MIRKYINYISYLTYLKFGFGVQIVGQYNRKALFEYVIIAYSPVYGQGHLVLNLAVGAIERSGRIRWNGSLEREHVLALGQLQLWPATLAVHILIAAIVDLSSRMRLLWLDRFSIRTSFLYTLLPACLQKPIYRDVDCCRRRSECT